MDLEPKPVVTNLTVEIPKQELSGARLPPPPSAEPAAEQPSRAPEAKPDAGPTSGATKREPSKTAVKTDAARKEAEAKRAMAALNAEGYVVPLGAYASKENVKQLEAKLAKAKIKHYTETVATANGEQTRVRAGPYPSKAVAESARDKLKSLGFEPGPVAEQ
jgi:DedD protein